MAVLERKPRQTHLRSFTSIALGAYLLLGSCALGAGLALDMPLLAQASAQTSRGSARFAPALEQAGKLPDRVAQAHNPQDNAAPEFEVATIRPSASDGGGTNFSLAPDRFSATSASLTELIQFAYNINSEKQLPKTPSWIASEKFDVTAKIGDAMAEALKALPSDRKLIQYRLMVKALLEQRFKLKITTAEKEFPVYALVLAKGGPKPALAPVPPASMLQRTPMLSGFSHGQVKAAAVSMSLFADWLSGRIDADDRVVVDATGLKGGFDFSLNWTPTRTHPAPNNIGNGQITASAPDDSGVSLFTALQEQLGLKLEPHIAPLQVLIVDHVEHPSEN